MKCHPLYLRPRGREASSLYLDGTATALVDGGPAAKIDTTVSLRVTHDRFLVHSGELLYDRAIEQVEAFRVVDGPVETAGRQVVLPPIQRVDSFMRHELESGSCTLVRGKWRLSQRGGGLAKDRKQTKSYGFRRAVNPFSIRGQDHARLLYGTTDWFNYYGEARFYFGPPRTGSTTDQRSLPLDTDMLVVQGQGDGVQVGFGWRGSARAFQLLTRTGTGPWKVLATRAGKRPPLTNWIRLGLQVRNGLRAEAFLDGLPVLSSQLDRPVIGGFAVESGKGLVECDDIRIESLPRPKDLGTPLLTRSANFADKKAKKGSDPEEFNHWARGSRTFFERKLKVEGEPVFALVTSLPLLGDLAVTAKPAAAEGHLLPEGKYEILLYRGGFSVLKAIQEVPLARMAATYQGGRWRLQVPGNQETEVMALELARSDETEGVWACRKGAAWIPLTEPQVKPVFLAIAQRGGNPSANFPSPDLFEI
ncbi:MAG: hypothetical protein ACYTGH_12990, partial [Planctomycetota bacterium]